MNACRLVKMSDHDDHARVKLAVFCFALLSPALLFAAGCDPYDELRCSAGFDWNTCRCMGGVSRPPATTANLASQDMAARAVRDNRFMRPINGSGGELLSWSGDWELRWLDYQWINNRQVRIYHATGKGNPSRRYTTYYDPDAGRWLGWQPM